MGASKNSTAVRQWRVSRLWAAIIFSLLLFLSAAWISADVLLGITAGLRHQKISETLTVPNLVGLEYTGEAMADGGRDFYVVAEGKIESDAPEGAILEQSPAPDVKRKKRDKPHVIRVTVSAGKKAPSIPDLRGLDVRDAKIFLEDKGFKASVKYVEHSFGDGAAGTVLGSTPTAGDGLKVGGEVILHVKQSAGASSVRCPDLRGMYLTDAISTLRAHGLKLGEVKRNEKNFFSSTVSDQGRLAGSYLPRGSSVDVALASQIPENTGENINNKLFFKQEIENNNKFWRKRSFKWHTTRQEE